MNKYSTNNTTNATIDWILNVLKRTPLPISPTEAAQNNKTRKQPGYFKNDKYYETLNDWKDYQNWTRVKPDIQERLLRTWFGNPKTDGVAANAGYNGECIVSYIDLDKKLFLEPGVSDKTATEEQWENARLKMQQAVEGWENGNQALTLVPKIKTQGGGYRYILGLESITEKWGDVTSFTFSPEGGVPMGEIMSGPGGLGIIAGKGIFGDYEWVANPLGQLIVFPNPESIGLYKFEKAIATSSKPIPSIYDTTDTPELAREALSYIPVYEDYQTWINIGMACHAAGLDFEDWDNWSQGGKNYADSNDAFDHWKSFKDKPGGIQAGTLFHYAKQHGWKLAKIHQQTQSRTSHQVAGTAALKPKTQSNVVPFQRQQPQLNIEDIEEKFKQLSEQNLSKSKLRLDLNNIARECNVNPKEIQNAYREYCEEIEDKESQADTKSDIEKIFENKNRQLDLSEYLSGNLSKITELSKRFGLRPELAVSVFLSAVSGLQNVRSDIDLLDYTDFRQPLIVFNAIVAEPSQKKSPLIKKIVSEPLKVYQRELKEKYKQEMLEYESLPEEDKPKDKPILRQLSISGGTRAGLRDMLDKHAKHGWGVLIIADELAGNIKNKSTTYNIGLEEDELSYYEGDGKREALKDDMASTEEDVLLSIVGGIQPKVFSQFNDGSDFNGRWARYNLISQPLAPMIIPENPGARIDLTPLMAGFYKAIATLPELHLRLSPEAKEAMRRLYNTCEMRRVEAKTQSMQALWGKAPGKIGRIAGLLHIIHQVESRGTVEDVVVSKTTLNLAAKLVRFYIGEAENLYGECSQDELAPKLVRIIELAEKRQTAIGAREIKQFDRSFSKTQNDEIRSMFTQLVELGYGQLEGSGSRLKFKTVDNCRQTVDKTVDSETTTTQGLQPTVDTVDKKNKKFQNEPINQLDEITHIDDVVQNPKEPEKLSTVSTVPHNLDTVDDTASTEMSTERLQLSTVPLDYGERSTLEPISPSEPLDFDHIKEGDILFDGEGQPHKITRRSRQLWQTHRKTYISRNDILQGKFHRATVEDVTKLIERTIKGKNKIQAQWLCDVYGGEPDSLMAKAIDTNPEELALIFEFDDWA